MEQVVDASYRAGQYVNNIVIKIVKKFGKGFFYMLIIPAIGILFFIIGMLTFKKKE
jgi:hypothetical protein